MTRLLVGVLALTTALVAPPPVDAQAPTLPAGHWEGTLAMQGQTIKMEVDIARTDNAWEGRIAMPDLNVRNLPVADLSVAGEAVTFTLKGFPGEPRFNLKLSSDGKTLSGDFTQGPNTAPMTFTWTGEPKIEPLPKSTPITKELEGSWEGAIDAGGTTLRLEVKLSSQPDGTGTGVLVSVDQGGVTLPISAIMQTGAHVKFLIQQIAGTFEGDLKDGQMVGTWTQGPGALPLTLKRKP